VFIRENQWQISFFTHTDRHSTKINIYVELENYPLHLERNLLRIATESLMSLL